MRARIPLTFLLFLALGAGAALAQVEVYSDRQTYVLGDASKVKMDFTFGDVQVEGVDGNEVEIDYRLTCSRQDLEKCRRRGERIRVVPRMKKGRFVVDLKHTPRGKIQGLKAKITLRVPRQMPVDVDVVGGGGIFVTRMLSDVVIAGTHGDVDVIARHERTGKVNVSVVAGKAELWLGDGHMRGKGVFRSLKWRGPGESRINIDLGTGDARVRLE